jgi:hypothetical protein
MRFYSAICAFLVASICAAAGARADVPSGAAPSKPLAYSQFVKDAKRQIGLLDVLQKDDETYLDLESGQLGRTYIVAPVLAAGVGGDAFAGRVYPSFLVKFKRVGKRILWISPNTRYTASPEARASLDISVADSVLASTPIAAESQETGRIVVSAAFFLTDIEDIGHGIGSASAVATLDAGKSYIERVKAFPKNVEILADLAFNGTPGSIVTAPDSHGAVVKMHYSILEQPRDSGYVPRMADDRVGYFITAQKHFGDDDASSPFVRYINRWDLRKGPITYYLTNEIPPRYRSPIARALLAWNDAFAKIGYPHAIEVKNQPDDRAWDPDDIRYSTVRWIAGDTPSFAAYAPVIVDPADGEILRAEIVIDGEAMRTVKRGYADMAAPLLGTHAAPACQAYDCGYMSDSAALAAMGSMTLGYAKSDAPARRERYAEQWLESIVLHEAGHTLGLRHNFAASTIYPLAMLHDPYFTATHGLIGSVMEYVPVNLSPKGESQGEYFQVRLGLYDAWAIRYGYAYFPNVKAPEDEASGLRAIASQSTQPEYAYGTDEDAEGPGGVDPYISTYDLSSDPLAFDANQFAVANGLLGDLDRLYPRDDVSYYEERQAFLTIMRSYSRAERLTCKFIGGVRTSRAHRGQAGGGPPLRSISREEQRRAFDLLAEHVFSAHSFSFAPRLLNDLGEDHYPHWNATPPTSPNFPIGTYVAALQDDAILRLFDPEVMLRLTDRQIEADSQKRAMSLGDLFAWTQAAVWDDFSESNMLHRNLQHRWTDLLIGFSLAPSGLLDHLGYPGETSSQARYELSLLAPRLHGALVGKQLDRATRANLADISHRVDNAMSARSVQGS